MHLNPTDFRRYTRDGLAEIGTLHGLKTVAILPVHSMAQTIGWIAWEWAQEKNKIWHKAIVYPLVWLWTRLSYKTDHSVVNNANTFQIIYTK
jgi:hypothetical protein